MVLPPVGRTNNEGNDETKMKENKKEMKGGRVGGMKKRREGGRKKIYLLLSPRLCLIHLGIRRT